MSCATGSLVSEAATPEALPIRLGVRGQVAALIVLVCVAGVGTAAWLNLDQQTRSIQRGLFEQSTRTAEVLARSITAMILRDQVSSIQELSEEALRAQGAAGVAPVVYVTVTDPDGVPIFDSLADAQSRVLRPELAQVLTHNGLALERLTLEVVQDEEGQPVLDVAVPCAVEGVDGVSRNYGLVRLGTRLGALEARWKEAVGLSLVAGVVSILLGLLVGMVAAGNVVGFLSKMAGVVERIARGDLSQRIRRYRPDELGQLASAIDRMADDLQKRELLKRYISSTAWDEIEERGAQHAEDHEVTLKEVTVLFLDIRNYTSLSELYQSREIVGMLNEVFTILIGVVEDFGGVLDKFIGDALLVVFYPGEESDDAVRAVYAACRMQEELEAFNQRRRFYGRDAISIGVGINTGTVIAGSVGSAKRRDYTVIGDPVNVAARLQERSKQGRHTRVILSDSTFEQVSSLVEVEPLARADIRGRKEAIGAHEVVALKGLRAILDGLEADDPKVSQEAFRALEATGGSEALPHLIQVLGSERQAAVLKAIPILARLGRESDSVQRLLVSLVVDDEEPRVLATAIRALGNLEGFQDGQRLEPFLAHPDARVRANTIEALDGLGLVGALDMVAPLLHDENQRVKANAAVALWKHGRREVVETLISLAESGEVADRSSAVFALGELFASEAVPLDQGRSAQVLDVIIQDLGSMRKMVAALMARLSDPSPVVIEKAAHALAKARDTSALLEMARVAKSEDLGLDPGQVLGAVGRIGTPPRVARLLRRWRQLHGQETATGQIPGASSVT